MSGFAKRILGTIAIMITLGAVLAAVAGFYAVQKIRAPGPLEEETLVNIPRGAPLGGIADLLKHKNIIESKRIFVLLTQAKGKAAAIKAGDYEFEPRISMIDVLEKLEKGTIVQYQIMIPEGRTNFEIDRILLSAKDLKQEKVEMLPEGSYLPETYSYTTANTNADVLDYMHAAMKNALDTEWENRAENLPIKTKREALILASIIEKETAVADERKRVAGVFINRLRKGMPLQTDPTVIYALNKGKHQNDGKGPLGRRLLKKDLKIDSPYNTYLYPGLPPGPIANPGRASINAALNPEEHDYIYFVADGTGGHAFGKTLAEHNSNVAKWRKIRKQNESK